MTSTIELGKTGELKDGAMKQVAVPGRQILLARVGDKYYAADNRCPHLAGNLAQGSLEGAIVTCPRHGSRFDLTDGHVVRWTNLSGLMLTVSKALKSPRPLTTYQVKVEKDRIMIEI